MKRIGVFLLCFVAVLTTISAQNTFMGNNTSTTGVENGYEWVDLGLPSGLKWATCNVGATKPKEIGHLFAWGEVEPKEDYSLGNYKWYNASDSTYTKYYTDSNKAKNNPKPKVVDNKVVLDKEDDAASVNMGGRWRMPTDEEFLELMNLCRWERTKKGYKVIGPNGSSIFLSTYFFLDDWMAAYWTRSLDLSNSFEAKGLFLTSGGFQYRNLRKYHKIEKIYELCSLDRYTPRLVRGVYK